MSRSGEGNSKAAVVAAPLGMSILAVMCVALSGCGGGFADKDVASIVETARGMALAADSFVATATGKTAALGTVTTTCTVRRPNTACTMKTDKGTVHYVLTDKQWFFKADAGYYKAIAAAGGGDASNAADVWMKIGKDTAAKLTNPGNTNDFVFKDFPKGAKPSRLGTHKMDGKTCVGLRSGNGSQLWIDVKTHLPVVLNDQSNADGGQFHFSQWDTVTTKIDIPTGGVDTTNPKLVDPPADPTGAKQ